VRHDCFTLGYCFNVTYDFGFARCVAAFFLGALASRAQRIPALAAVQCAPALQWAALAGLVAMFFAAGPMPALTFLCPPVFALLLFTLARDTGPVARVLRHRWLQMLGERSYSIYMMHPIVQLLLRSVLHKVAHPAVEVAVFVVYVAVVLLVSKFTYERIEVPCRNYFNRIATQLRERTVGVEMPARTGTGRR
jgi:peptidoglycan/LPS O-acetylase OafA/YrhL